MTRLPMSMKKRYTVHRVAKKCYIKSKAAVLDKRS